MEIIFATRPSRLARCQTDWVMNALSARHAGLTSRGLVLTTRGDRVLDRPLPEIGGKGLFTEELEHELLSQRVHAAVHSLKDLPVDSSPGLTLGAVPERADARDVLITRLGISLDELPSGSVVGTSSLRRSAQLLALRPDLKLSTLRGNIDTRLNKLRAGQYDAILLAAAGLIRLGLEKEITQWLTYEQMLPAPGQGALAVQCRAADQTILDLLDALDDKQARITTQAERAFLAALGGGCSIPVAAHAEVENGQIKLEGLVAALNGRVLLRATTYGFEGEAVGRAAARDVLAQGAGDILASAASQVAAL
jgi:hydroxymethylbilane synthase